MTEQDLERAVCAAICRGKGLRAREIAAELGLDHKTVNRALYGSPLMKELCWQDRDFRWHGLVRQDRPHAGLEEFAGWYGTAEQFTALSEAEWMAQLTKGCGDVGRNLNDTRGLLHSFRDCRAAMLGLFRDLREMLGDECLAWELAFELRLKRARYVRIYADVLVITDSRVFSLEFKMKDKIDPEELKQAAKYTPYLEIVFGLDYEIIPVLVLTAAAEFFDFVRLEGEDRLVPVCSGDMLFNVFDEYMGFLQ
ncbi:MAG: helix-turn-helix domain containing protein [Oscillospiraceae bacterium]|nr:helix-turn-helix domain containing protein [Oscillospiraceae bacterium]